MHFDVCDFLGFQSLPFPRKVKARDPTSGLIPAGGSISRCRLPVAGCRLLPVRSNKIIAEKETELGDKQKHLIKSVPKIRG